MVAFTHKIRTLLKAQLERINSSYLERLLALSLLKEKFPSVRNLPCHYSREKLWEEVLNTFHNQPIVVLEFGVWEGYSIRRFAKYNVNPNSKFYGFDSFEGLPEDWSVKYKKGAFNADGHVPEVDDNRIFFVKGWFQNTLHNFLEKTHLGNEIFVHYDSDLFSATLYVMLEIDKLKIPYYAVFDEFTGHETRALYRYMQISGARLELIARTGDEMYPSQISCRIIPTKKFAPEMTQ